MARLPLFPHNEVVLFPGMVLPMHIFEERYLRMVRDCLAGDRRFGVVLALAGYEIGPVVVPARVGTAAVIQECREIEGRYVLLAVGEERFEVREHWLEDDLVVAEVEPLFDTPDEADDLAELARTVRAQASEHLRLVGQALGRAIDPGPQLPAEPADLSFYLAGGLQANPQLRQELLELTDTRERLRRISRLLRDQVRTLSHRAEIHEVAEKVTGSNGHLDHSHLTQDTIDKLKG